MHRSRSPLKLHDSPLVLALAQVRFSPVLKMQTFIPEMQERLRKAGYPRFDEAQMQQIVLGPMPTAVPGPATTKWVFTDRDGTKAVVVAQDFVTFEVSKYDTFDAFSEELRSVLNLVGEVTNVELAERLGLRYLDHIRPVSDDTIEEYVAPGLAGVDFASAGAERTRSVYIVQGTTASGQYVVRLNRNTGQFVLPADLQPPDVNIAPPEGSEEYAVLDVDHFSAMTREYQPDVLIDVFWQLHDVCEGIFREAVTPYALKVWRAEDLEVVAP